MWECVGSARWRKQKRAGGQIAGALIGGSSRSEERRMGGEGVKVAVSPVGRSVTQSVLLVVRLEEESVSVSGCGGNGDME